MKKLVTLLMFLFATPCLATEPIKKVSLPLEVAKEIKCSLNDPLIEGKEWNRWTSKNFTVCSINNQQAQYLHEHLELLKSWAFARWGLFDVDFDAECRLICVDDPELFKKLFNMNETNVEIRRDKNGKIELSVIFMLLDDMPSKVVPVPITEVCLAEFEQKYETKWPWWSSRGISMLNGSLDQIKSNIKKLKSDIDANRPMYFSESLMKMNKSQWEKLSDEKRALFDRNALALCLMLRKSFGQNKLHWILNKSADGKDGESVLKDQLGFRSYNHFDQNFKRYMIDISRDVTQGKMPDSYLIISAATK
jgi:hypothetical protein